MAKVLLIEPSEDGRVIPVKALEFEEGGDNLAFFYKHIECRLVDIVRAYALADVPELEDVCLVIDDEGLYKEGAKVNILGSLLYGVLEHGQPLVGNVLVCKDVHTPDGVETGGLTDEEILMVDIMLGKLVDEHNARVKERQSKES